MTDKPLRIEYVLMFYEDSAIYMDIGKSQKHNVE